MSSVRAQATKPQMKRIFVHMDLQADINWIMTELLEVKDPDLIEAFKKLLKYRKKNAGVDELNSQQKQILQRSLDLVSKGETIDRNEIRERAKEVLGHK